MNALSFKENSFYKIGAQGWVYFPKNKEGIQNLLADLKNKSKNIFLITGKTNILMSSYELEDCIFIDLSCLREKKGNYFGAGIWNTEISEEALQKKISGFEWMYLLPGCVGASARMNARAYGFEYSKIVRSVEVMNALGDSFTYLASDFFQGYKKTKAMEESLCVLGVMIDFNEKADSWSIYQKMVEIKKDRLSKHHFEAPSCGSFFKNNYEYGIPSGKIFDELGFRGKEYKGAQVSPYHGNFIWNKGNAHSDDILELAVQMRECEIKKKGILLDFEVELMGWFPYDLLKRAGLEEKIQKKKGNLGLIGAWIFCEKGNR